MADESAPSSPTSETPPPRTTGGGFRWEPPSAAELQAMMPGYTIEKILGRGGMGAVYKGVQTNLDRTVAIKILPPGVEKEDPSFAERFKNEAKLMAKLLHPAVVAVFDFGLNSGGQLYIAMEYVDGTDVAQMISTQKKLPPDHALAITAHVCDALTAAHELGIVHRDIKPANVLINMKGQVKVADFGLAKIEEPGSHGLTKTGYAMGTPDFVAPEALMLGTAIDGRADVYAVGVMLYQMLTGNIPRGAFKPASVLVPALDRRYDPIIQKAMQHDREERHQSAAELRRELDVILTVPLVQNNAPAGAAAAIPAAQVAQVPAQRSAAQKPVGKPPQQSKGSAGTPARNSPPGGAAAKKPEADKSVRTPLSPAKSKTPLFAGLGIAAVLGIGAFVMFSGGKKTPPTAVGASAPPSKPASVASSPPKPATSTPPTPKPTTPAPSVSKSPPLPISASSPQFPPGQWVKLFDNLEEMRQAGVTTLDPKISHKDGWFVPSVNAIDLRFSKLVGTNLGIRGKFKPTQPRVALDVASDSSGHRFTAMPEASTIDLSIPHETKTLFIGKAIVDPRQEIFTMEYACVEGRYIGRLNEKLAFVQADRKRSSARLGLYNAGAFRDIEVINLDGLSEAEALKILGVDEKGNDLRKPAAVAATAPAPSASKSPPLPVSASSDKFPPGQWVKVFTTFEDLPEDLRKPDSGVKFEDGWIDQTSRSGGKGINFGQLRVQNVGVRAVIDYSNNEEAWLGIRTSDPQAVIEAAYSTKTREFGIRIIDRDKTPDGWHHAVRERIASAVGRKAMIEIGAVGDRVIAHLDSRLLPIGRLANLGKGGGRLTMVAVPSATSKSSTSTACPKPKRCACSASMKRATTSAPSPRSRSSRWPSRRRQWMPWPPSRS
jgi:serine/threonine protein kinase